MIVYLSDLSEIETDPTLIQKYEDLLSDVEKKKYRGMSHLPRRLQFLVGRALIRENCHQSPALLPNGKPTVQNGYISLAHSGPYVLLAVSDSPIGVDIEDMSKNKNFDAISARFDFTLTQNKRLSFYQNFTRYEADYKMGETGPEICHKYFSINTFIICISSLNNNENVEFIKSIPMTERKPLVLGELPNENL